MEKRWFDEAWKDYLYWQMQDKKTLKRINILLRDIERNPFEGIGKPEPLRGELGGLWSRRIDEKLHAQTSTLWTLCAALNESYPISLRPSGLTSWTFIEESLDLLHFG